MHQHFTLNQKHSARRRHTKMKQSTTIYILYKYENVEHFEEMLILLFTAFSLFVSVVCDVKPQMWREHLPMGCIFKAWADVHYNRKRIRLPQMAVHHTHLTPNSKKLLEIRRGVIRSFPHLHIDYLSNRLMFKILKTMCIRWICGTNEFYANFELCFNNRNYVFVE